MLKNTCLLITLFIVSVTSFKFWPFAEEEKQMPVESFRNELNAIFVGD